MPPWRREGRANLDDAIKAYQQAEAIALARSSADSLYSGVEHTWLIRPEGAVQRRYHRLPLGGCSLGSIR